MKKNLSFLIIISALCFQDIPAYGGHPVMAWGMAARLRYTTFDNALSLNSKIDDGFSRSRHLTNLWMDWRPSSTLRLHVNVLNENYYWFKPSRDYNINETFFNNLFLQYSGTAGLPFIITLGRQDIRFGEGFLVMDAHPLDGSRSIYFNAARLDIMPRDSHKLTVFYSFQDPVDDWLPILNPMDQAMIEEPNKGMGIQYDIRGKTHFYEFYLINKWVSETASRPFTESVHSLGMRASHSLGGSVRFTGEGAYQFGKYGEKDRSAFGIHAYLDYLFDSHSNGFNKARLGIVHLSGNHSSEKHTGWDPMFSRWPKWSFSYIWLQIHEYQGRIAYWSNLQSFFGALHYQLLPKLDIQINAHYLTAPASPAFPAPLTSGNGSYRGFLVVTRLGFDINKYLRGHIMWDVFQPGDYYFKGADSYQYLHAQLDIKIK